MSEVRIYNAYDLDAAEWRQLQGISRDAFAGTLDRSQQEVDALVEWNDPMSYHYSHRDPNWTVDKWYNANQSYSEPRVAVVTYASEVIGFAYSANNVSGKTAYDPDDKHLTLIKNYLWLREVAVAPGFQYRGFASVLVVTLLENAVDLQLQPVSTYIWPDEMKHMQESLEIVGFEATGEQDVRVFGEDSLPIRQMRMQAASARSVLKRMVNIEA